VEQWSRAEQSRAAAAAANNGAGQHLGSIWLSVRVSVVRRRCSSSTRPLDLRAAWTGSSERSTATCTCTCARRGSSATPALGMTEHTLLHAPATGITEASLEIASMRLHPPWPSPMENSLRPRVDAFRISASSVRQPSSQPASEGFGGVDSTTHDDGGPRASSRSGSVSRSSWPAPLSLLFPRGKAAECSTPRSARLPCHRWEGSISSYFTASLPFVPFSLPRNTCWPRFLQDPTGPEPCTRRALNIFTLYPAL
jgi:hypothetical protein